MHSPCSNNRRPGISRRLLVSAAVGAAIGLAVASLPLTAVAQPPDVPPGLERKLLETAEREGKVNVIVGLSLPGRPFELESNLPDQAAVGQQRAAIAQAQRALEAELAPFDPQTRRSYQTIPFMSLSVNVNALQHLLNSPRITSIEEVQLYEPTLMSTGQWIGSLNTWDSGFAGFGGQGYSVAIIDTGIDRDHPFFASGGPNGTVNRVVDEACFSNSTGNGGDTLCPDESNEQYGQGAAHVVGVPNCYDNLDPTTGVQICDHGTHVAGIAAGQDDGTRGYDGVAPMAGIVAVQAAHRSTCNGSPCARFWSDDTIAGLDWIRVYSDTHTNVAAVNMSLGGGFHWTPCTGDAERTAIQNLKAAGIATVISAGNNHWTWATGSPGCIPEAVTVSSVYDSAVITAATGNEVGDTDGNVGRLADDVRHNMAYWVDLMAVGWDVDSAVPDDDYDSKGGTSMAAPQVTGAFAVLRSIIDPRNERDDATVVDEIEKLLKDTGPLVQDQRPIFPTVTGNVVDGVDGNIACVPPICQPRTGIQKPRLQLDVAVADITSADLRIYKDCKPDGDKVVGSEALCHLTVQNLGPQAAMEVVMRDEFVSDGSDDFSFGNVTVEGLQLPDAACSTTPNVQNPKGIVTCRLGGMMRGDQVDITIPVTAAGPLNVNNRAEVWSGGPPGSAYTLTPDPYRANNTASDSLNFVSREAAADLGITKTSSPGTAIAGGDSFTYEIAVTNAGPDDATNVVVTDQVPAGLEIVSVTPSAPGSCNTGVAGQTPTVCNLNTLSVAGGPFTVDIEVRALPGTRGQVANNVSVSSDVFDPNNSNNLATATTLVNGVADIQVEKELTSPAVVAGFEVAYRVDVTNLGPSTATGVVLTDVMPAHTSFVSAKDASDNEICTPDKTDPIVTLTCAMGTFQPGESKPVFIKGLLDPATPVGTVIVNTATAEGVETDPDTTNNEASTSDESEAGADLWIDKQQNADTGNPSGTVLFTLTVHNRKGCSTDDRIVCGEGGPSDAEGVMVVDTLPWTPKEFVVQYVSEGCEYVQADHKVYCAPPDGHLAFGTSIRFDIQATVKGSKGDAVNTACVSATTPDPVEENDCDVVPITVKGGTGKTGGKGSTRNLRK
jgi:uncharacterized repeat protein (TIGR01451 family)